MIKIKSKWFTDLFDAAGVTILIFVFHNGLEGTHYTKEWKDEFWNHERIHIRQQWELLFIFQWILYGIFYLRNRKAGLDHKKAYKNNPFEIESYKNSKNLTYLSSRRAYAWKSYVKDYKNELD